MCVLPSGLVQAGVAPIIAAVARRRGPKPIMAAGCIVMIVGYLYRIPFSHDLTNIVIGSTIVSIGTALSYSTLALMVMRAVPVSETGAANGQNTLLRSIGQSVSSAVVASVLGAVTATLVTGGTAPTLWAYQLTFILAGLGALGGLALTLAIPGSRADAQIAQHVREILGAEIAEGHDPGPTGVRSVGLTDQVQPIEADGRPAATEPEAHRGPT
jgi:MFS family permease